jgi:hypothetical protein
MVAVLPRLRLRRHLLEDEKLEWTGGTTIVGRRSAVILLHQLYFVLWPAKEPG